MEKKEYQIIGSNNFWYASCLPSFKAALEELEHIVQNHSHYADGETGAQPEYPEKFYIYESKQVAQIGMTKAYYFHINKQGNGNYMSALRMKETK